MDMLSHPYLLTTVICFITGYIPTVSTEIFLAGLGLNLKKELLLPIALTGALSQTLAKIHIYSMASYIIPKLSYRKKKKLISIRNKYHRHSRLSYSIIFISSLTGLPPYYLLNLLCGLLNTGLFTFSILGCLGMFIRFSCCLFFPMWILYPWSLLTLMQRYFKAIPQM